MLILGAGAPYETRLNAEACRPAATAIVGTLGADWQALRDYVQTCPVSEQDGLIALTVAIVRIDRMQKDRWFDSHQDPHIPLPVILDSKSHVVGKLPEGFPADLPGALRVTFKDWKGGMPRHIDQYETFEAALPPHSLAGQTWDPHTHSFIQLPDHP